MAVCHELNQDFIPGRRRRRRERRGEFPPESKLEAYGVRDKEKEWFLSYWMERQQRIVVGAAKLAWCEVVRGGLQSSILGPLLFTLFMNDLPNISENFSVNLYADHTAIYFSSKDHLGIQEVLETELRAVARWMEQNRLKMNVPYCPRKAPMGPYSLSAEN